MRFGRAEIWTFVGAIGAIVVAGEEVAFGYVGGDVTLSCPCWGRKPDRVLAWQKGEEEIIRQIGTNQTISPQYKTRVELDAANCSLRLTDLTADDQSKYWCYFYSPGMQYAEVYLNVTERDRQTHPPDIGTEPLDHRWIAMIIIPMVLVLGLSLALFHRWKVCRGVFMSQQAGKEASSQMEEVEKGLLKRTVTNSIVQV